MKKTFDYHKEFFHRPFWTPANQRFLFILVVVFLFALSTTFLLMQYVSFLPEVLLRQNIKEKYITYLSNIYMNVKPTAPPTPSVPEARIIRKAETATPAAPPRPTVARALKKVKPPRRSQPATTTPEVTALQKGRVGGTNPLVARAIEAAPGLIQPSQSQPLFTPSATYRRKAESYEIAKAITGAYEGVDYSIPPPEYTDFEIAQGYRNEEEIIMAVNGKKKYIRYCINKFHRNDPSIRGNIVVKFKIHPDGYVIPSSIKIVESDIPDPRVLRCIKRVISRWRDFPKVAYEDGIYTITQKYVF